MPAFGEALSVDQLQKVMDYIRTMCGDDFWPRGELNLPRPLVTEKAYPEDEAVISSSIDAEGTGAIMNEFVIGDMALGVKRAFYHSAASGTIFSMTGKVILSTGDVGTGRGQGSVFGPYDVDTGRVTIMHSASGFKPEKATHVQKSEVCATCHTLYTHALGPDGEVIGELPEQVP